MAETTTDADRVGAVAGRELDARVLVCGGRNFSDRGLLRAVLDYHHARCGGFGCVIHGAARGADRLADDWARDRGVTVNAIPADWSKHGKSAGPIRNREMLETWKPTLVIAFPGGNGTEHMVRIAEGAGVRVVRVTPTSMESTRNAPLQSAPEQESRG